MPDIATNFTDNIGMTVSASYLNGLGAAVNANTHAQTGYGTYASMPDPTTCSGSVYFCSDIDSVYRSNGTTWDLIRVNGTGCSAMGIPQSGGLSNTTLGTATFTADKGSRLLSVPSNGSDILRGEHWALSPASNYTATFYLDFQVPSGSYSRHGIYLLESSSNKLIMFGVNFQSSFFICAERWNSLTSPTASFSGTVNLPIPTSPYGSDNSWPHWFRVRDDGTNRNFEFSYNGLDWKLVLAESRTAFITPNYIGWGGDINNASNTSKLRLRSYALT